MNQKKKIIDVLNKNAHISQSEIAFKMYNDKTHGPNIYSALNSLVMSGLVCRIGKNPARYSLVDKNVVLEDKDDNQPPKYRDVSCDFISNETIEDANRDVEQSDNYGPENKLITSCLRKFPYNTDIDIVAMKIGLIDITNSTHLSQHKSKINMCEFSERIAKIPNIDERLKNGDPEVVNEIAKSNGKINLFSFATKYCCYHNRNLYGKDDYSILDNVLKEYLPRYFHDVTKSQIQKWQNSYDYKSYNDYITKKLDELGITIEFRKRKFDHFVWFKNR